MLRGLRVQLMLLSLVAAIGLVALLGGGSYYLLNLYMQRSTDLALQTKMALQFRQYGLALPPELARAEQDWLGSQIRPPETSQQAAPAQFNASPAVTVQTVEIITPTEISPALTITATPIPSTPTATALVASQSKGSGLSQASQAQLSKPTARPSVKPGEEGEDSEDEGGGKDSKQKAEDNHAAQLELASTVAPAGSLSGQVHTPLAGNTSGVAATNTEASDGSDGEDGSEHHDSSLLSGAIQSTAVSGAETEAIDEQLNSVFVIPLDTSGQVIRAANGPTFPTLIQVNNEASASALLTGYDVRTTQLGDGSRARLLTYRTAIKGGPELLQVGRLLNEQDRVLRWFLTGVVVLAAISAMLLGLGSWWLSGRALSPAQRAWENQQIFIANASHELRAPLTLVKANAEVGLRLAPPPEQREVLTEILNESDYMNRLVEDLLLLSRLDTHRLKLEREAIAAKELLEEVQRHMSLIAASKSITIKLGETAGTIWGDPVRVRQVILILIDNSLRYTPVGGLISLESHLTGRSVRIVVSDDGVGIPAADLPHIFDRFYQAQRPGEEEARGNGLGLSIAKALVEAQGGEIQIASMPGQGTLVSLQLPSSV
jgi:signal transduction histidine kinase